MAKFKRLTEEQIISMSKRQDGFYMHKYKWSHDYVRKICKRLQKQGIIKRCGTYGKEVCFKYA